MTRNHQDENGDDDERRSTNDETTDPFWPGDSRPFGQALPMDNWMPKGFYWYLREEHGYSAHDALGCMTGVASLAEHQAVPVVWCGGQESFIESVHEHLDYVLHEDTLPDRLMYQEVVDTLRAWARFRGFSVNELPTLEDIEPQGPKMAKMLDSPPWEGLSEEDEGK